MVPSHFGNVAVLKLGRVQADYQALSRSQKRSGKHKIVAMKNFDFLFLLSWFEW
jgi:hypothetical protein